MTVTTGTYDWYKNLTSFYYFLIFLIMFTIGLDDPGLLTLAHSIKDISKIILILNEIEMY